MSVGQINEHFDFYSDSLVLTADVELEGVRLVIVIRVANDAVVRRHVLLLRIVDIHK